MPNRFETPEKVAYKDTYISQYVPLPFEQMQKKATIEKEKFDSVQDNAKAIQNAMGEMFIDVDMNPLMSEEYDNIMGTINDELHKYKGDWRKLENTVDNLGKEYQRWITSGQGAIAKQNKMVYDENNKAIMDSDMAGIDKERSRQYGHDTYAQAGGATEGHLYKPVGTYNMTNVYEEAIDNISKMKADGESTPKVYIDDKRGLLITGFDDIDKVDRPRIRAQIEGTVRGNQDFQDMVRLRYEVGEFYGDLPEDVQNLEDYMQYEVNKIFNEHTAEEAMSYENETSRRNASFTPEYKAGVKRKQEIKDRIPLIQRTNIKFQRSEEKKLIAADKDNALEIFNGNYDKLAQDYIGITPDAMAKSPMYDVFKEINNNHIPADKMNEAYSAWQQTVVENNLPGVDLNTKSGRTLYMQSLANGSLDGAIQGSIKLKGVKGGTNIGGSEMGALKKSAVAVLKEQREKDKVIEVAMEEMKDLNLISLEQYNQFTDFENMIDGLETIYANEDLPKDTKLNVSKFLGILTRASESGIVDKDSFLESQAKINQYVTDQRSTKGDIGINLDILSDLSNPENYYDKVKGMVGTLQSDEFKKVGEYTNGRIHDMYSVEKSIPIDGISKLPQNLQTEESEYAIKEFDYKLEKELKSNPNFLRQLKVRSASSPDGQEETLENILIQEFNGTTTPPTSGANTEVWRKYQNDLESFIKKRIDEYSTATSYANTKNPVTNNSMLIINNKYSADIGDESKILGLDSTIPREMDIATDANTYIAKAEHSPSGKEDLLLDKSVSVITPTFKTPREGAEGKLEKEDFGGNRYKIQIDLKKFGITNEQLDGHSGIYKVNENDGGNELLRKLRELEYDKTSTHQSLDGKVYVEVGNAKMLYENVLRQTLNKYLDSSHKLPMIE